MHVASTGIDLAKATFHLVALGERNKVLVRKKFSRAQLLAHTANLPSSLIGVEACAGAHFMGAALRQQGHQLRGCAGGTATCTPAGRQEAARVLKVMGAKAEVKSGLHRRLAASVDVS